MRRSARLGFVGRLACPETEAKPVPYLRSHLSHLSPTGKGHSKRVNRDALVEAKLREMR